MFISIISIFPMLLILRPLLMTLRILGRTYDRIRYFSKYKEAKKELQALKHDGSIHNVSSVFRKIKWVIDPAVGIFDYQQNPIITWIKKTGDCVLGTEEVITREGIKLVRDLKDGDFVLSYDFEEKEQVYKKISNFKSKGVLPVKEVEFKNRSKIYVTEKHPLFARTNQQGNSVYEKTYLSDIDLTRWWKNKIPCAKKLDIEEHDVEWFTKELAYLTGHYLAEGWMEHDGWKVSTSGHEIDHHIIPLLEQLDIPFTDYVNNCGVPCLRYLKSDFKDFLKTTKHSSFDIHLPEWILYLPEYKIKSLLEGYFLGDGHYHQKSTLVKVFSTSSDKFASDVGFMLNRLGTPAYMYQQLKHGGLGSKPIWRVEVNENSHFNKYHGYNGMSEVGIRCIKDYSDEEVFDFSVEDTQGFFFKNGLYSHNCDDFALMCDYLVDKDKYHVQTFAVMPSNFAGHVMVAVQEIRRPTSFYIGSNDDFTFKTFDNMDMAIKLTCKKWVKNNKVLVISVYDRFNFPFKILK